MTFTNWRNSTVLSLTIHWIFAIGESHIGESPIGEIQVTQLFKRNSCIVNKVDYELYSFKINAHRFFHYKLYMVCHFEEQEIYFSILFTK